MAKDKAYRKWMLTINNPLDNGFPHATINEILQTTPYTYYCLCDETGEQGTPHTHVYVVYQNAVLFDTMKKRFYQAHIEPAKGTPQDNRAYIRKDGKWVNDEKHETNHIETFEEYGELPPDKETKAASVSAEILELIKQNYSTPEILCMHPTAINQIDKIEKVRQMIIYEDAPDWRDVYVTYIYGGTGVGKTSSVIRKHGAKNVYKVTNYKHPFDAYAGQDVLLLDEFRSSLDFSELLNYLDGYSINLPCRYQDKVALYTQVYIVSNIALECQYPAVRRDANWDALLRRIHLVLRYERNDNPFIKEPVIFEEPQNQFVKE
ncbi:MAG: replication protein [Oscillospiraceae bacterium]|nr:replication protein [Oscillospiraceae bacterium]